MGEHHVRVQRIVERRVTLDARTVARIANNRPQTNVNPVVAKTVVNDARNVLRPTVEQTVLKVATPGTQGRPGRDGGISIPPINFTHGDVPHVVWTPPAPGTITLSRVEITEEFDGIGAQFFVGVPGNDSAIMRAELNNPYELGSYEMAADFDVAANVGIVMHIVPGSASRGAGTLYLEFVAES